MGSVTLKFMLKDGRKGYSSAKGVNFEKEWPFLVHLGNTKLCLNPNLLTALGHCFKILLMMVRLPVINVKT